MSDTYETMRLTSRESFDELVKRTERLERLYKIQQKKTDTLYHRSYAISVRRHKIAKRVALTALRAAQRYERTKEVLGKAAKILVHLKPGRKIVYLTPREKTKLLGWLRTDFRRSKP